MEVLLSDDALEELERVDAHTYRAVRFDLGATEANAAKAMSSFEDEQPLNWLFLPELELEQEPEQQGGAYYWTKSPTGNWIIVHHNLAVGGGPKLASDAMISGGLFAEVIPGASGGLLTEVIPAAGDVFAVTFETETSRLFTSGYQLPGLHLYITNLPAAEIQQPSFERFIERIDEPGYRSEPVLKGKGIPVWAIAAYVLDLNLSYEEVVADWEGEISVDEVKAAMEYYQAHPEEIEQKRRWTPPR